MGEIKETPNIISSRGKQVGTVSGQYLSWRNQELKRILESSGSDSRSVSFAHNRGKDNPAGKLARGMLAEKLQKERYKNQLMYDPLTEAYSRRYLMNFLPKEVNLAEREGLPLVVVFIDVDNFKKVNDSLGHFEGDQRMKAVAQYLRQNFRKSDAVCRFGGDEFVVVMPGAARYSIDHGKEVSLDEKLEKIRKDWENMEKDKKVKTTLSIGAAELEPNMTSKKLLEAADSAVYAAKNAGKNIVKFHKPKVATS